MSNLKAEAQKRSTPSAASSTGKKLPQHIGKGRGVADWANADPALVLQLVCAVAREGGAVRYGYTRDGGAYSIGLYLGQDSKTYYCNNAEGINDELQDLLREFENFGYPVATPGF